MASRDTPPEGATLRDWIEFTTRRLSSSKLVFGHGTSNARDEAVWLMAHASGLGFEKLDRAADRPLPTAAARSALRVLRSRIATRKPLAYVLKEAWLAGERFYVDERVLVPRSFIAELLPTALDPWLGRRAPARILDLCTGSACLAILAAKRFAAKVDAADISAAALVIARRNIDGHRLRSRVTPVRSDLFKGLGNSAYDLIVTNPPYVREAAMQRLPAEYRHEPALALAAGRDGLDLVVKILQTAAHHLSARGVLVAEIGHNRAALERRVRGLGMTWLSTSEGEDIVLLATREQLLQGMKSV